MGGLICNVCVERESVVSHTVIEHAAVTTRPESTLQRMSAPAVWTREEKRG
jgi:hypothetical protein